MSQRANVNNAARLGYTKTGKTTVTSRRNSSHRNKTVSGILNTRQKSHAGKKEPRMSKEGARVHPAPKNGARSAACPIHLLVDLRIMAALRRAESGRRPRRQVQPEWPAPACELSHRRIVRAQGPSGPRSHP